MQRAYIDVGSRFLYMLRLDSVANSVSYLLIDDYRQFHYHVGPTPVYGQCCCGKQLVIDDEVHVFNSPLPLILNPTNS